MQLKYLITGTGRCGTVFLARFLTSIGIPCGHEAVFSFKGLDNALQVLNDTKKPSLSEISTIRFEKDKWLPDNNWLENIEEIVAESSYMAAPFLSHESLKDTQIIHLVRDPIKVVESFCNIHYFLNSHPNNKWEEFIYHNAPELTNNLTQIDRACLYYIIWNKKIEKNKINLFFKLEDNIKILFDFLNKKNCNYFNEKVNTIWKKKDIKINFNLIKEEQIKFDFAEMGKRYGYSMARCQLI